MREEQNLDRNGQTGVQDNDDNQQDTGRLCIDGRNDWVSVFFWRLALIALEKGMSRLNIQVSEKENGGHGKTNADECVVERCDRCQNTVPVANQAAAGTYEPKATKTQAPQGSR